MQTVELNDLLSDSFSDHALIHAWGRVEAALAQTQAELEIIPKDAAHVIVDVISQGNVDIEALLAHKEKIGHPLIPYLRQIEEACGEHGTWLHYGATTDNILYTGLCLNIREALEGCAKQQVLVLNQLCDLAEEHAATVMAGRTHSQQALPISFGYKVAGLLDECSRNLERQDESKKRCLRVMLGGAIGSFAAFGEKGSAIQDGVAKRLKLEPMPVPLRSVTDAWVEIASVYTLAAGTLAKLAADFKNLCRSEIAEIFQDDGSVGSSTMPQKRNPVLYNAILQAFEQMQSASQRMQQIRVIADDGDSLCNNVHREAIVEIIRLYYFILQKTQRLLETVHVNKERMLENIQRDGAWIMSESLMFALSDVVGKTEAHDLLHELAMQSKQSGESLQQVALAHAKIRDLGEERIQQILNPVNYLGDCESLTHACIERLRQQMRALNG